MSAKQLLIVVVAAAAQFWPLSLASTQERGSDCAVNYRPHVLPLPATPVTGPRELPLAIGRFVKARLIVKRVDAAFAYGDLTYSYGGCGRRHKKSGWAAWRNRGGGHVKRSGISRYHGGRHRASYGADYDRSVVQYETPEYNDGSAAAAIISGKRKPVDYSAAPAVKTVPATIVPSCGMHNEAATIAFPHMSCGAFVVGDVVIAEGYLSETEPGNAKYFLKDARFWRIERDGAEILVNYPEG